MKIQSYLDLLHFETMLGLLARLVTFHCLFLYSAFWCASNHSPANVWMGLALAKGFGAYTWWNSHVRSGVYQLNMYRPVGDIFNGIFNAMHASPDTFQADLCLLAR